MRCDEIAELLPDYFQNALPPSSRSVVEAHLRECTDCAAHVRLWNRLAELPDEAPSPRLRERFEEMLDLYRDGRGERKASSSLALWLRPGFAYAAALLILAIGFLAGRYVEPRQRDTEVAELRTELSSTNN